MVKGRDKKGKKAGENKQRVHRAMIMNVEKLNGKINGKYSKGRGE